MRYYVVYRYGRLSHEQVHGCGILEFDSEEKAVEAAARLFRDYQLRDLDIHVIEGVEIRLERT